MQYIILQMHSLCIIYVYNVCCCMCMCLCICERQRKSLITLWQSTVDDTDVLGLTDSYIQPALLQNVFS